MRKSMIGLHTDKGWYVYDLRILAWRRANRFERFQIWVKRLIKG